MEAAGVELQRMVGKDRKMQSVSVSVRCVVVVVLLVGFFIYLHDSQKYY